MLGSETLPIPPPAPAISQLYIVVFETNKTELFIICHGLLWKVLQPQLSLETSHIAYFIFFNDFIYIYIYISCYHPFYPHDVIIFFKLQRIFCFLLFLLGNELYNLVLYLDAFVHYSDSISTAHN